MCPYIFSVCMILIGKLFSVHLYCFLHCLYLPPCILEPPPCQNQVDLCFIIDSSGSITDDDPGNWNLQLNFVANLLNFFTIAPDATRVGAVVFSETVSLEFSLDTYTDVQSVKDAILNLVHLNGETNTPEAFRIATNECFNLARGDRPNVDNLAIFISDGKPHPPETRTEPARAEAEALKNSGAFLLAIGITDDIDMDFLRTVSSPPQIEGQSYFRADEFTGLDALLRVVGEGTCEIIEGAQYL